MHWLYCKRKRQTKENIKMKQIAIAITLVSFGFLLLAGTAAALTTGILPGPEVPVTGNAGILDQIYGLSNLTRIDDDFDQIWNYQQFTAKAVAKYAGFSQNFGYISESSGGGFHSTDFVSLFNVPGGTNGIGLGGPVASGSTGGNNFLWALKPSGAPLWTSKMDTNIDGGLDHMVTWLISGSDASHANTIGNYVIAWEDLFRAVTVTLMIL
jgi:hypothetical protein